jgi:uncharacterized protein (TIGR02147 family)
MDASFVNRILNGKKKFPRARMEEFIKTLDIDELGIKELKLSLVHEFAEELGFQNTLSPSGSDHLNTKSNFLDNFEEFKSEENTEGLFKNWFRMALLDLHTLPSFELDIGALSEQLNIEPIELENALQYLIQNKYLIPNADGKLMKSNAKTRFATKQSQASIRRFHKEIMSKAVEEMYRNVDSASFKNRYITSATLTVSKTQIEKIRLRLQEMILEVVDMSNEGTSQSLYGLNFSFFPLIRLE